MTISNKLRTVIRHEFLTIVKQPSFWISLVAFPLVAGIILLIGSLTDSSKNEAATSETKDRDIVLIDNSGLISSEVAGSYGIRIGQASERQSLETSVREGSIDGLIVYPRDLVDSNTYQLYADDTDRNNSSVVQQSSRTILQQSLLLPLQSEKTAALALSGGQGDIRTFKAGENARQMPEYIVPGTFLVLFYIILVFSVGYALTSVSEEKENRSIEMVLSYLKPRTLITGKLAAIILVTLTQIVCIGIMAAIGYLIARSLGNEINIPLSISDLTFVPQEIFFGLSILVFGFIFYVGLMAMIGAIFPSSKEASGFSTVFFILPAIPFWGIDAVTNQPREIFSQILTYFPLTSPTTALIRNAAGNLSMLEGLVSLAILVVSSIGIVALAAKAFQHGTLEYNQRIKLGVLFRK